MNGTKILSGFNVLSTNPIDSRYITDNLSAVANPYIGLRVYNKEDNKIYVYRKTNNVYSWEYEYGNVDDINDRIANVVNVAYITWNDTASISSAHTAIKKYTDCYVVLIVNNKYIPVYSINNETYSFISTSYNSSDNTIHCIKYTVNIKASPSLSDFNSSEYDIITTDNIASLKEHAFANYKKTNTGLTFVNDEGNKVADLTYTELGLQLKNNPVNGIIQLLDGAGNVITETDTNDEDILKEVKFDETTDSLIFIFYATDSNGNNIQSVVPLSTIANKIVYYNGDTVYTMTEVVDSNNKIITLTDTSKEAIDQVPTNTENIAKEIERAKKAETELQKSLDDETTRATTAENNIANDLTTEISTRKSEDERVLTDAKAIITNEIDSLDADLIGKLSGTYIRNISETDGVITATAGEFDTDMNNPTTDGGINSIPTTKAVANYVERNIHTLSTSGTTTNEHRLVYKTGTNTTNSELTLFRVNPDQFSFDSSNPERISLSTEFLNTLCSSADVEELKATVTTLKTECSNLTTKHNNYEQTTNATLENLQTNVDSKVSKSGDTVTGNLTVSSSGTFKVEGSEVIANSEITNLKITSLQYKGDELQDLLDAKQVNLVSGTNIKTINGNDILGSGNLQLIKSNDTILKLNNNIIESDMSNYFDKSESDSRYYLQSDNLKLQSVEISNILNVHNKLIQPIEATFDSLCSTVVIYTGYKVLTTAKYSFNISGYVNNLNKLIDLKLTTTSDLGNLTSSIVSTSANFNPNITTFTYDSNGNNYIAIGLKASDNSSLNRIRISVDSSSLDIYSTEKYEESVDNALWRIEQNSSIPNSDGTTAILAVYKSNDKGSLKINNVTYDGTEDVSLTFTTGSDLDYYYTKKEIDDFDFLKTSEAESGYLKLTGGTLTGTLNGTTLNVSSSVVSPLISYHDTLVDLSNSIDMSDMSFSSGSGFTFYNDTTNLVSITSDSFTYLDNPIITSANIDISVFNYDDKLTFSDNFVNVLSGMIVGVNSSSYSNDDYINVSTSGKLFNTNSVKLSDINFDKLYFKNVTKDGTNYITLSNDLNTTLSNKIDTTTADNKYQLKGDYSLISDTISDISANTDGDNVSINYVKDSATSNVKLFAIGNNLALSSGILNINTETIATKSDLNDLTTKINDSFTSAKISIIDDKTSLVLSNGTKTVSIPLANFGLSLTTTDGVLSLSDSNGNILSSTSLLDDRIIKTAKYDASIGSIVLTMTNDDIVNIPIDDFRETFPNYSADNVTIDETSVTSGNYTNKVFKISDEYKKLIDQSVQTSFLTENYLDAETIKSDYVTKANGSFNNGLSINSNNTTVASITNDNGSLVISNDLGPNSITISQNDTTVTGTLKANSVKSANATFDNANITTLSGIATNNIATKTDLENYIKSDVNTLTLNNVTIGSVKFNNQDISVINGTDRSNVNTLYIDSPISTKSDVYCINNTVNVKNISGIDYTNDNVSKSDLFVNTTTDNTYSNKVILGANTRGELLQFGNTSLYYNEATRANDIIEIAKYIDNKKQDKLQSYISTAVISGTSLYLTDNNGNVIKQTHSVATSDVNGIVHPGNYLTVNSEGKIDVSNTLINNIILKDTENTFNKLQTFTDVKLNNVLVSSDIKINDKSIYDIFATKSELNSVYNICGTVETLDDLPTNPAIGDIYCVKSANSYDAYSNFVYNTKGEWSCIGVYDFDAENFVSKTYADNNYVNKTDADAKYATIENDNAKLSKSDAEETYLKKSDAKTTIKYTYNSEKKSLAISL